jgi:hypothetical protein
MKLTSICCCCFLFFLIAGITGIKEVIRTIQDTRRDRGVIDLDKQMGSKNLPLRRGFGG